MSISATGVVIEREYAERVKKKSFIISTLLLPLFMVAMMTVPAFIMMWSSDEAKNIAVVDRSGIVGPRLESDESMKFILSEQPVDSLKASEDYDGVLIIPGNVVERNTNLEFITGSPISLQAESDLTRRVERIVEEERMKKYNVDVKKIMDDVEADFTLHTIRTDKENANDSSAVSYTIGLVMTFLLYMCLLLYGQMVMTSIIEEKNNRVLEIVVSSVKPANLMLGKIAGIGLVAATQIIIWIVLIAAMSAIIMPAILPQEVTEGIQMINSGHASELQTDIDMELLSGMAALSNTGYLMSLMGIMLAFLLLGFTFYAAIYAAIGSAVDNIQDASQLQTVAVLPIILGIFFGLQAISAPTSSLSVWTSMIPFTSPMVMMARVPFGIDAWQIALSLVILALSTWAMVWIAAKIYRVGIFMYGKKPTVKELIRWTRFK